MTVPPATLDRLLAAIEERELRSLQWGYVDGSIARDDVEDLAAALVGDDHADDLVEELIDRRLAFEVRGATGPRVRSRFGEGVRLQATPFFGEVVRRRVLSVRISGPVAQHTRHAWGHTRCSSIALQVPGTERDQPWFGTENFVPP